MSPRLTLNLGVRYEFNSVPYDLSGMQVVNDKPLNSPLGEVAPFPRARVPTGSGITTTRTISRPRWVSRGRPSATTRPQSAAVTAWLTIAWSTGRSTWWSRTSPALRAPVSFVRTRRNGGGSGFGVRQRPIIQTLVKQLSDGIVGLPVQRVSPPDRSSTPLLFDPNMRTPFVNQWNISIQRQITRDTVLEVAYVGNKGTHMFRMMNANQANISSDFIAGFKAAQGGVRTGVVGKLLDTFGTPLPSSTQTLLTNNDLSGFITAVDTNSFNGVVGGRFARLPQG